MKLSKEVARDLASCFAGTRYRDFEVVENRDYTETRWMMVMELVVRDDKGGLYRAFYERGLTEYQECRPFEDAGDEIEFKPVTRRVVETYAYEDAA